MNSVWRCSAFSGATLFCGNRPVPARSLACVDLTDFLWAPAESLQWRWLREKRPREERKWRQERLSCRTWKKNWRLKQTKTERVGAYIGSPVRWNEGRSRKRSVIFSYFESCCDHELLLIWKKRWFTVKEAFLLTITWLVCNMTRLHRSSCQCRYWFNWLDDDAPCTPKTGNTAQRWLDLFVFAAF